MVVKTKMTKIRKVSCATCPKIQKEVDEMSNPYYSCPTMGKKTITNPETECCEAHPAFILKGVAIYDDK